MSTNDNQTKQTKKEEVAVKEVVETKEIVETNVEDKAAKKAKIKGGIIKGLKIAGIALGGAIVGFICGKKSGGNANYEYETVVEDVDSDVE